jgi:transposase-like protein
MEAKHQDVEKKRFWQQTIREAIRSKLSIREFCRQHRLKESQFYWWQRKLNGSRNARGQQRQRINGNASFALVSNDPGAGDAGIELILQDGRRLRISRGVDEQTLRAVLAAVGPAGC